MVRTLDPNIALRVLIVDKDDRGVAALQDALRMVADQSPQPSVRWSEVRSVVAAYDVVDSEDPTVIFIDLISTGLRDSVSFVQHIRQERPTVVFILYCDEVELRTRESEVYVGWGARLRHYFLLDKAQPDLAQQLHFNLLRAQFDLYAYGSQQALESLQNEPDDLRSYSPVQLSKFQAQVQQLARQLAGLRVGNRYRSEAEEDQQAFVIMSFDPSMEDVRQLGIKATLENAGFVPYFADEHYRDQLMIESIYDEIHKSRLIVADLSDPPRANCYYELGFADALGKRVIRVASRDTVLPLDLAQHPVLFYDNVVQLRERLSTALTQS